MPRIGEFEFNFKEFSGALGDFGTFLPLAIGFIVVNDMNPGSFMLVFGLSNIATGLIYRAPMPLQPMKAIAAVAIATGWSGDLITATALSMGLFWLFMSLLPQTDRLISATPPAVIRGIQLALGISLGWTGLTMITGDSIPIGIAAVAMILMLNWGGRRGPSAIIILIVGLLISISENPVPGTLFQFTPPEITFPSLALAWEGFYRGGIAQIPLTFTNAVIACAALLTEYFPERRVPERYLMGNMALMNLGSSLLGGFPMCHGAGGLASQYYFGARTGGANIMEGTVEVLAGLFLGSTMVSIFSTFPEALVGAMMLMVGIELGKFSSTVDRCDLPSVVATAAAGVYWNLGIGFLAGLTVHFVFRRLSGGRSEVTDDNRR